MLCLWYYRCYHHRSCSIISYRTAFCFSSDPTGFSLPPRCRFWRYQLPARCVAELAIIPSLRCSPYCLHLHATELVVEELVAPPSKHQLQKIKTTPDDSTALTALSTALLLVLVGLHASAREQSRLLPLGSYLVCFHSCCSPRQLKTHDHYRFLVTAVHPSFVRFCHGHLCFILIIILLTIIHLTSHKQISPCQPSFHPSNDPCLL